MGYAWVTEDSIEWVTPGLPRIQWNKSRLGYQGFSGMGHTWVTKDSMECMGHAWVSKDSMKRVTTLITKDSMEWVKPVLPRIQWNGSCQGYRGYCGIGQPWVTKD